MERSASGYARLNPQLSRRWTPASPAPSLPSFNRMISPDQQGADADVVTRVSLFSAAQLVQANLRFVTVRPAG
jgi:hypothetical protein